MREVRADYREHLEGRRKRRDLEVRAGDHAALLGKHAGVVVGRVHLHVEIFARVLYRLAQGAVQMHRAAVAERVLKRALRVRLADVAAFEIFPYARGARLLSFEPALAQRGGV